MTQPDTQLQEEQSTESQDSDLVKDLRKQIRDGSRDAKAQIAALEARLADTEIKVRRDLALESTLKELNQPEAVRKLIDADSLDEITLETVRDAVLELGFNVQEQSDDTDEDGAPPVETQQQQSLANSLNSVASLGNQIAQKASGTESVNRQIESANSMDELDAVMRKAGLHA